MKLLLFPISLVLLIPSLSLAELSFCNGVWTNQACNSLAEEEASPELKKAIELKVSESLNSKDPGKKVLKEKKHTPPSKDQLELKQKESLIHEVTMRQIEARRKHDVLYSAEANIAICQSETSSLKDCKNTISEYDERLDKKIENALKLKELENKEAEQKKEASSPAPTTVIIREPGQHLHRHRKNHPHILRQPGDSIEENGVSIDLSGSSKNKRIQGGVSIRSGESQVTRARNVITGYQGGAVKSTPLKAPKRP